MTPSVVEDSQKIPCFLFSNRAKADPIQTACEVYNYYVDQEIPLEHQIDFIVVNKVGIISNYKYPETSRAGDDTTGRKTGIVFEEWGPLTIAAFLLYLNLVPHATSTLAEPVLPRYLAQIRPNKIMLILSN